MTVPNSRFKLFGQYPVVELPHTLAKLHAVWDRTESGREVLKAVGFELGFPENGGFLPAPAFRGGLGMFITVTIPVELEDRVRKDLMSYGYRFVD